jgi:MFS transporter, DHA1 family, tetracycline resistance protein
MGFMAGAALTSLLSVSIAGDRQGALQGLLASINGVAAVLTPLGMPWVFSEFSGGGAGIYFPGAPYVLSAALAAGAIVLIGRSAAYQPSVAARVAGE